MDFELNERFKEIRKALNLTQSEFSECIGFSQSSITMIEIKKREVQDRHIKAVCLNFNVNEEWLRTGKGEMFLPKNTEDKIIEVFARLLNEEDNSFAKQLVSALSELTPEQWKAVEDFARKVVYGTDSAKTEKEEE